VKHIGENPSYIGETKIQTKKHKNAGQRETVRHNKSVNVAQMFYNLFLSGILPFYQCG
jgi:hypothetical protein